jgi:translation initiation factor IF-3
LLQRLAGDIEELGYVEAAPKQDGRNMIMVIAPHRKQQTQPGRRRTDDAGAEAPAEEPGSEAASA